MGDQARVVGVTNSEKHFTASDRNQQKELNRGLRELGLSVSLVYNLRATGKIRHERHGLGRGVIRIPKEALDEYRQRCTKGTTWSPVQQAPTHPPTTAKRSLRDGIWDGGVREAQEYLRRNNATEGSIRDVT